MQLKRKWIGVAALALTACGGGGGGGGGSTAPSGSIKLDKTTLSVSALTTGTAPTDTVAVTISLSGATSPSVTATSTSSGIESVSAVVNSASSATVTITFKAPSSLAAATYDDTVTIKACTDSACGTALSGSPATVTTHYTVTQPATSAGSFTLDAPTVSVSAAADAAAPSANVGVTIAATAAGTPQVTATSTTNGIASISTAVTNPTHAAVVIAFKSPASLAVGNHDDTITLNVCADSSCAEPLKGSPASIAVHYTVAAAGSGSVKVSGTVTFDKVPGNTNGIGLNYAGITQSPARGVLVEAVMTSDRSTVAASASTDATGAYSLSVPANTGLFLRVKAEMLRAGAPAWHYRVLDNVNSNALYAVTGADFNSGTADSQRNLNAPSGWGGSSYTATRAAAPFAILDTVYQATSLVQGANATAIFPALDLYWSKDNIPNDGDFNAANGDIQTTQFNPADPTANPPTGDAIYILGDANTDTDEYDASVIAHEWGHYFQDSFSRDDSFGGVHRGGDRLDLRVAFSEGWGDAFSGMAINRSVYQDSNGNAQADGGCLGLENDAQLSRNCAQATNPGWYSEASIARVLWQVFDSSGNSGADTIGLGFKPIYTVMNNEMVTTRAVTSIYPFAAALKTRNAAASAGIDAILNDQDITVSDEWGSGETNDAGDSTILPLYISAAVPGTVSNVCSNDNFDSNHDGNKIGVSKFLKFTLSSARSVTINATRASKTTFSTDPDLELFGAGLIDSAESSTNNSETLTRSLAAGTYVVEVYEYSNTTSTPKGLTCFNVAIN